MDALDRIKKIKNGTTIKYNDDIKMYGDNLYASDDGAILYRNKKGIYKKLILQ